MPTPSDPQLDVGETVVAEGIRIGTAPREIARQTFVMMRDVKNPAGRPAFSKEVEDQALAELRGGLSLREVSKKYRLSGTVRQRLQNRFRGV